METLIRDMRPGEEKELLQIGRSTFHSLEGFMMSKPKQAKVALIDGAIAGGMFYKTIQVKDKKVGYIEYAFITPKYHGRGVGSQLYRAILEEMRELGYDLITAMVKGDNPGSYLLMEKNGLKKCSIHEIKRYVGIYGIWKIFWQSSLNVAVGMDFYSTKTEQKKSGAGQIAAYLLMNLLILLLSVFVVTPKNLPVYLASAGCVLGYGVLLGGIAAVCTPIQWTFRFNNGGLLISVILALVGSIFPMYGKWFPKEIANDTKTRRSLCINAVVEWIGFLAAYIMLGQLRVEGVFYAGMRKFMAYLLIYRMIPSYPFSEIGSQRILEDKKWIFCVLALVTLSVLIWL